MRAALITLTTAVASAARPMRTLLAVAVALVATGVLGPVVTGASAAGGIELPPVTVPSVTVPSVTTPPVDVPAVSTPVASTPPLHVPSVTTPSVSTPSVSTPSVSRPPVRTPRVPVPAPVASRPAASRPAASRPAAPGPSPPATAQASVRPRAAVPTVRARATPAARRAPATRRPRQQRRAAPARRAHRSPVASHAAAVPTASASRPAPDAQRPHAARPAARVLPAPRRPLLPGAIGDIAEALPRWVLFAFIGFALIAMAMAVNAFFSARRARMLGAQRAALLDDVGLLQTALLAPVPALAGDAQVSVAYRPAAGPAAGGDFYDVIALGRNRTGLLLGDVSGHGREAVRHAALVRYTVRTFLAAGHDPAEALARAEDCLEADLDGNFATVIAGVYDHDTATLRYAKAGHHPPVIRGTAHDPEAEPTAPPLGVGLGGRPTVSEVRLDRGTTVCLFTDGLIEARRDGVLMGRETLVALLDRGCPDGPELLDRLVEQADEIRDDLAVCVLRRP